MKLFATLGLGLTLIIGNAQAAGDLKAPLGQSSGRVLPPGIRNLSYKTALIQANDKFNGAGDARVLADPFFKNIDINEILKGKDTSVDIGKIEAKMHGVELTKDSVLAETTGQVNVTAVANVPIFALGATQRLTLAMAVPIIQTSVNADVGVIQNSENIKKFADSVRAAGDAKSADEILYKMKNPIAIKLDEYGYDPLSSDDAQKLGDIKLVGKYSLVQESKRDLATQFTVTLPTGQKADVDKIVDVAGGDGQTDLALGFVIDEHLTSKLDVLMFTEYTWQLEDELAMRVPERSDSRLTPDKDLNTTRNLGDIFSAQVGLKYQFENSIHLATSASYMHKYEDRYQGNKYASHRYDWMSEDTAQELTALVTSLGYDTISLFRKKQFPVPITMALHYSVPQSGKNVVKDPSWTFDFGLFF